MRIVISGILGALDGQKNINLILMNEQPNGQRDYSTNTLIKEIPIKYKNYKVPYEIHDLTYEDTRGNVKILIPTKYRKHWESVAESMRGQYVKIEATIRTYKIHNNYGVSLDLFDIKKLN